MKRIFSQSNDYADQYASASVQERRRIIDEILKKLNKKKNEKNLRNKVRNALNEIKENKELNETIHKENQLEYNKTFNILGQMIANENTKSKKKFLGKKLY